MRYLPPGTLRRQRWLGRLEGSIVSLALVTSLGLGLIAATPAELYQPAPTTHRPTPEGGPARFQHAQMPPCGPGKDCSELDDDTFALPPHFPLPSPDVQRNQVPEPGTLALVCVGIALMRRKAK